MAPNGSDKRIVIVGGGIMGVCTAYYLTRHALFKSSGYKVTLLEGTGIAAAASGKAGGLLALDWHGGATSSLATLSYRLHRELAEEHGGADAWGYRGLDTLSVTIRADEKVKKPARLPHSLKWIDPTLASVVSTLGTAETTSQVHPYRFTNTIFELARAAGVEYVQGTVTSIDSREVTYETPTGDELVTLEADKIVVATGPWTSRILSETMVTGERAHSVVFDIPGRTSAHALFTEVSLPDGTFARPEVYARSDEIYVCGESDSVPLPPSAADIVPDKESCKALANQAKALGPEFAEGTVTAEQACYLPVNMRGGNPIIHEVRPGVYCATGHSCWGICLGPGTGKVMSELLLDGSAKSANIKHLTTF